jgi:galactokinase
MIRNKFLETRIKNLKREFNQVFGSQSGIDIFNAPGRVNIIGEHTDYNGGYVLPIAINLSLLAAVKKRKDTKIYLKSLNFSKQIAAYLANLKYKEERQWANYPLSAAWALQEEGFKLNGANIVFEGNIPIASGLSSSAAIEVLTMKCLLDLSGHNIEKEKIPILCRKGENDFIGVKSGIMDQFIISFGKENNALFLNCETLYYKLVPFSNIQDKTIIIGDTKIQRGLVKSAYNQRLIECQEGLKLLKKYITRENIKNLSNIEKEEFEEYKNKLPKILRNRCEHVIFENDRVVQAVEAIWNGDLEKLGELITQSHYSLKELYEVSCKELDIMVEAFLKCDDVYGARMTGAGFGGCSIALVEQKSQTEIIRNVSKEYKEKTGINGEFHICRISDGVQKL